MDKLKTILSRIKMPKVSVPKVKMPRVKVPKISLPKLNINLNKVKPYLLKTMPVIKKAGKAILKGLKGFIAWFGKAIKESIAQVWTLLGFFIAWLTLTGTAQQIVGLATIAATILWLITIPLREEKE